ncbi:hypothetical protein C0Q70_05537 [Pomacea canaliculata]|uniref:G-protein coupled receptors family 1 profile domain-containing protein n=1 Tax=Pomacea canaliculata TaxID=400727 RepID=A0A2T7PLH3_POMCA|nr:hypothetical protein C0Q70_05537 [Pomacea canaliculata]
MVTTALQRAVVWLNALACLERFLVISFPLQSALLRQASGKKLVFVIVAIFLTSLLAHVYLILQRDIQSTGGDTYTFVSSSLLLSNPTTFYVSAFVSRTLFLYFPLALILLLDLAMVFIFRLQAAQNNLRMSRGQDGRNPEEQSDGKKRENRPENHSPATINSSIGSVHPEYGMLKKEHFLYISPF